jgi:hypothetical protein
MTLNINGYFTNLAPVAQVAELQEFYECQDQSRAEVTLYSSSFDEATPGDVVSTSWYEHAGSCTETLLGTGDTLSVEFGFGVHEITLSVEDTQGISHSIDFAVEVRDSQIDHAEPPPDIWVPQQDRDGAHVCLGPAFASDICSGSVLVSKNAPDCDDFPVGMSLVEWRFDDQFGNVLYHDQKVFVVDHAYFPPPRSFVSASLPAVQTGQTVQLFHETQPQGLGMFVDEYVVVYGPDQFYASIDDSGGVHHHSFVARRTNWTVGAMPTADVVFSGVFSDQFTELGLYQIETTLVVPGGDPANPADILAHGTLLLELTS